MNRLTALVLAWLLPLAARGADWPQFQGPNRNNISPETGLLKEWPKGGPALAWTFKDAGVGYSSPAVVGDRVYISGGKDGTSYLIALDLATGKEVWRSKLGVPFDFQGNQWGAGPRATPTVAGGMVYALEGDGTLACFDAKTGKEVWRKHMVKDFNGEVHPYGGGEKRLGWGFCWSPLVDDGRLICVPGGKDGAILALDPRDGKTLWRTTEVTDPASYATPIVTEIAGVKQYIAIFNAGYVGVDAKSGKKLWYHARKPPFGSWVITAPVYHDGMLFVTVGEGAGCELVKIRGEGGQFKTERGYTNKIMKNALGGLVLIDGHIYGYSERRGWQCLDLKTGKAIWEQKPDPAPGSIIAADGHLYLYDEDEGKVTLAEVNTQQWKQKGQFDLPEKSKLKASRGRNWTRPVLAHGRLFIRDQDLLFCFKLK